MRKAGREITEMCHRIAFFVIFVRREGYEPVNKANPCPAMEPDPLAVDGDSADVRFISCRIFNQIWRRK